MKKRVILHIGFSKSGSTTLQSTFKKNSTLLLKHGVLYPKTLQEAPHWLRFFWEDNLPITYSKSLVRQTKAQKLTELVNEINTSEAHTVILSDEGLISVNEESVDALKSWLVGQFPNMDIVVVVIVREPYSFYAPRCQQFLSDRYFTKRDIDAFLNGRAIKDGESRADNQAMAPSGLFSKNLLKFQRAFSRPLVFSFEEAVAYEKGFSTFFLNKFGIEITLSDELSNSGRSDKAMEIISFINEHLPFTDGKKRHPLRYFNDLAHFYALSGNKYRLDDAQCAAVASHISAENEWLSQHFGIDCLLAKRPTKQAIVWDEQFYIEICAILPKLRKHVVCLLHAFVVDRMKHTHDEVSKTNLNRIRLYIKRKHPVISALHHRTFINIYIIFQIPMRLFRALRRLGRRFAQVFKR